MGFFSPWIVTGVNVDRSLGVRVRATLPSCWPFLFCGPAFVGRTNHHLINSQCWPRHQQVNYRWFLIKILFDQLLWSNPTVGWSRKTCDIFSLICTKLCLTRHHRVWRKRCMSVFSLIAVATSDVLSCFSGCQGVREPTNRLIIT